MEIESLETISRIDRAEWDTIAGDDTLGTHRWLRIVEENSPESIRFVYFLVREGGKLVGAAACKTNYDASQSTSLDRMLYGSAAPVARRVGLGATPALVVGSSFGISEPFLLDPVLSDGRREDVAHELVSGILAESQRAGATVIVRNATTRSPVRPLARADFQSSPEMPTAYLDIRWPNFAAFRSDLKKIHFSTEGAIRQQNNRARRAGLVIERITDASQISSDMHELLDFHYRRLNGVPFPFGQSFLQRAVTQLGDQATLIVARDSTQLLGVNFGVRHGGCSRSMMIGIDPGKGRVTAAYFVLVNHSIACAIEAGDRRLYYGRMLYDVKLRRGCSLAHSTMWIRGRSPLQRGLLRSFIGMRTRKIEATIDQHRTMAEANAAAFNRLRR